MKIDVDALPDDTQLLRALLLQLLEAFAKLEGEKDAAEDRYRELFKLMFRPRTEKLNENQLMLIFEAMAEAGVPQDQIEKLEQKIENEAAPEGKTRKPRAAGTGRAPLPQSLPRERVEHKLPESERCCGACGTELTKIKEDISEQLEFVPAHFKVIQHVRGVYACKCCEETILRAAKAPQAIDKGLPGPGLLAQVIIGKFADHLPLNRQQAIFLRHGIEIPRSTQCCWVAAGRELVKPLVHTMYVNLLESRILKTDDTSVTVLGDVKGSYKGHLWVYIGDRDHPHHIFAYSPDREGRWPKDFLKGFKGYLQSDAYSAYDAIHKEGIIEVACWSHMRRYFYDAFEISNDKRALVALALIKKLFEIEKEAADLDPAARLAMRQERSKPHLETLFAWIQQTKPKVLPKSRLNAAFTYAENQWEALNRYTEDGELCIDNNASERALRAVAVGRKNWMFAGSDQGGHRAAIFYSLIASAKANGVEPFAYLRSLFELLPTWPKDRLHELWPLAWKAKFLPG